MKLTLDRLTWPLPMTCGACGAEAEGYPAPGKHGVTYCPSCSPDWLREFAGWASEQAGWKVAE